MKTITLDEDKLSKHIEELEEKRDEHSSNSAEWFELNDQIKAIKTAISLTKILTT